MARCPGVAVMTILLGLIAALQAIAIAAFAALFAFASRTGRAGA